MKARTAIQAEANNVDLDAFNLAQRMAKLGEATGSENLKALADHLMKSRFKLRVHMHPDDITETA